jgi:hypothetical protein
VTVEIKLPPPPDPDPHTDPLARALVAEVLERGAEANVAGLLSRPGVSEQEFRQRFASLEDCALDVYERFIASFERAVGGAYNEQSEWRSALRASAYAATAWMGESPELMEFGAVGVLTTGSEMVRVRREEVAAFCAGLVEQGREAAPDPAAVPESASLLAIGSILHLLTQRLQEGAEIDLDEMVPQLMYGVVRVYLGEEAAQEELSLPRPDRPGSS